MSEISEGFKGMLAATGLSELDEKYPEILDSETSLEADCRLVCGLLPDKIGDMYERDPSDALHVLSALFSNLQIAHGVLGPVRSFDILGEHVEHVRTLMNSCNAHLVQTASFTVKQRQNRDYPFNDHNLQLAAKVMHFRAMCHENAGQNPVMAEHLEADKAREKACLEKIAPPLAFCLERLFVDEMSRKKILLLGKDGVEDKCRVYFELAAMLAAELTTEASQA